MGIIFSGLFALFGVYFLILSNSKKNYQKLVKNNDEKYAARNIKVLDQQLYTYVRDELYPSLREKAGLSEAGDINEKHFLPTSYPLCYELTRGYNLAVYRTLSKLRGHFAG